jgi:hypothetical protein
MGLRNGLSRVFERLAGERSTDRLLPRAERRQAARDRHHDGGPKWNSRDRRPSSPKGMPIADAADTGPLAKGVASVPRVKP